MASVGVLLKGGVRANPMACPLPEGGLFLGGGWPIAQSPVARKITLADGFTGSNSAPLADKIRIWKGDATFGTEGYASYFLVNTSSRKYWVAEGNASLANEDNTQLFRATRAAFMMLKVPQPTYVQPLPWTP